MKFISCSAMVLMLATGSSAADAAAGKTVYEARCKMCHGEDGKGNPAMVKAMGVKPIAGMDEAATKEAVTKGKGRMKPVTTVTGKALDDVAAYVASLK